ncbi:MAG: hypothetical protein IPL55_07555 [Saprospiraceae bacterium]|nr:hypothetical protein [Saprospiraceae bacterium]
MVHSHQDQAVGTLGGTLVAFFGIVDGGDILKTIILACVGAIVSFCISKGMHLIWSPAEIKKIPENTSGNPTKKFKGR